MRDWLSHRVAATPDRRALVRARDGETWTYAQLDREVDNHAGRLATLGLKPGDHLGVVLPPRVRYVQLVHAAMRMGLVLVPLGHDLTEPELADRAGRADLTALVCGEETLERAVAAVDGTEIPVVSVDPLLGDTSDENTQDGDDSDERPSGEGTSETVTVLPNVDPGEVVAASWERVDPLLLLFTSGTTGTPKPVDVRMGNVLSSAVASAFRLGTHPDDRWLVTLSLHHTGGIAPLYRATLYGTTIVLREGFDPGPAADDIDRYDVTGVSLVPTMLEQMLDVRGTLSDSLRVVLLGGAPATAELIDRCQGFSIPIYPTYGMTETASQVATAYPDETFDNRGTVGRPLLWTDVEVVDDEGTPVEQGKQGEFVVSGPTVVPGYYGMAEETDATFGDRGFHTGDVGYVDEDGLLYVTNRLDDRIVTGGENVDPGEVVEVLRQHPDIADAAVVGVPDDTWGELVGALLVPTERPEPAVEATEPPEDDETDAPDSEPTDEDGAESSTNGEDSTESPSSDHEGRPTREDVTEFCEERLADFKRPRVIAFAESLPRTVSGTVDRDAVRERLEERTADDRGDESDAPDSDEVFEYAEPSDVEFRDSSE
ncbi:AMP-binding protein [Halalkaliarchaeum desulfuricum]|nr:class I adenylate-forming enzyme family protein [Halalkaliarchaeum desulfuricum]